MSSDHGASIPTSSTESSVADSNDEATKSLPEQQDGDPTIFMFGSRPLNSETGAVSRSVVTNLQMPNMQAQQHSMLFYFSLIEGRCRTQAAKTLNAGRRPGDHLPESHPQVCELAEHLFVEMSKELHNAGVLPTEFAGQDFATLRQKYLASFDNILNNIAIKRHGEVIAHNATSAIEGIGVSFTNNYTVSSSFASNPFADESRSLHSRALQPLSLIMAQRAGRNITKSRAPSIPGITFGRPQNQYGHVTSPFQAGYRQLSVLGKGGFGCVYRALDLTDDREYAIKKIIVSAGRLRLMPVKDLKDALLREVRGLAKLEHRNVVRYFGGWIEWRPAHKSPSIKRLLPGEDSSSSSSEEESADDEDFSGEDIRGDIRRRLDKEAGKSRADLSGDEGDSILFEDDPPTPKESTSRKPSTSSTSSNHPMSMFRKPGDSGSSDDDDDNTEEISRALTNVQISNNYPEINEDACIYIKMSVHPMTLEDYIWPEQQSDESKKPIKHCFHPCAAARILLAILDGVEYIHSQKIVHRDLKPSNIFLTVRDGLPSIYDGSVDISNCPDCKVKPLKDRYHIIPHIGDFGLIAEIKDADIKDNNDLQVPSSPTPGALFTPSPLAVLSSRQPGTRFYCPPAIGYQQNTICQKLDVFALGVIAFELITEFSTKSERAAVLSNLVKGEFPKDFDKHIMGSGVKGMLCADREQRWDCPKMREWLEGIEKGYKEK